MRVGSLKLPKAFGIAVIGAIVVIITLYFGATRLIVGHHFFTKYTVGDCIQDESTKTSFKIRGNAKDSYLCEVIDSGNTIPGSFQRGTPYALSINEIDKDSAYVKFDCLEKM